MTSRSYAALALAALIGLSGCASDKDRIDPRSDSAISTPSSDGTPAAEDTSMPPWPAPADVSAWVAAAGLDLGPMGTAEHYHPQLRIVIDGTDVPVPPNIGVDPNTGAMSALHTHEGDGTIHIEADSVARCSPSARSHPVGSEAHPAADWRRTRGARATGPRDQQWRNGHRGPG